MRECRLCDIEDDMRDNSCDCIDCVNYYTNISDYYVIDDISKCMFKDITPRYVNKNEKIEYEQPTFGGNYNFMKFPYVSINRHIIADNYKNPFNFKVVVKECWRKRSSDFNRYLLAGEITKENIKLFHAIANTIYKTIIDDRRMRNEKYHLEVMLNNYSLVDDSYNDAKSKIQDINNCIETFDCSYGRINKGALMRLESLLENVYLLMIGNNPEESSFIGQTIIITPPVTDAIYFEITSAPNDYLLKDEQSISVLFDRY